MSFHIGPLTVNLYGIIIMVGAVAGTFLAQREAQRRGQNSELVWDAFIWVLIGGIIGARLWHILTPPPSMVARGITTSYYFSHPLDALAIWHGGLGIPGAIVGGVLALYLYSRKHGIPFFPWVDIASPALAIGQAIGRWGNFVNQELYGAPTDLPWAILIDPQNRLPGFENQATYHPLFLYESIWNLANALFLLWLGRRLSHKLQSGDIFLSYLVVYPLGRFLLEFLRLDSSQVAGLNINQTLMLVVGLLSGSLLISRHLIKARVKRQSDTIHAK
ncbi:MAG: prolipoprotein diacylglyceryl transferase [Chloroflexi bacterium RBG_16_48_8]|nr:MAG: prolipoprotein diacylglyceryl transferase [Chloroflexi bacterium RBG_16_48_8]